MDDQPAWSVKCGLRAADAEIEAFQSTVVGEHFSSVVPLTSRSQKVFQAEIGGILTVIRVVSHVKAEKSARHSNAFHRLARALNPARMSSPAVVTRFRHAHSGVPANTDVVVKEHAPPNYIEGDLVPPGTLRRVGAGDRHLGAILCYIAHLADHGLRRNLMFSTDRSRGSPYWFIDLDFAFGSTMPWGFGRSIFYPGRQMNYQLDGRDQALPARAAELLDLIEGLPEPELSRMFGLLPSEANNLQARCSKLKKLGLAEAIAQEQFWGPEDNILTRWKNRVYAKFAGSLAGVCVPILAESHFRLRKAAASIDVFDPDLVLLPLFL